MRIFQALFEAGRELSATIDLDELMVKIMEGVRKICEVEASSLLLLDSEGKELSFKVALGEKGEEVRKVSLSVQEGIAGWVARHGEPLMINDVSADQRFSDRFDRESGFETRSILCVPILWDNKILGVVEAINKMGGREFSKTDQDNLTIFAQQVSIALHNSRLIDDLHNFFTNVIEILVEAIEAIDPVSKGHLIRVARLATGIAREMKLEREEYRQLYYASIIHDIGRLKGKGTESEHLHPLLGAEMVASITILKGAAGLIKFHHERSDGTGYPQGISEEEIPLAARILALAEAYDELCAERGGGKGSLKIPLDFLMEAEVSFDRQVIEAFKQVVEKGMLESIYGT